MSAAAYGAASVNADTTDYNVMSLQIAAVLANVQTLSLAKVVSCSNDGDVSPVGTVTVQILVNLVTGNGQAVEHGQIYDVPYLRWQGGGNAIIADPQAGDIGLVGFCSRDISGVQASKAQANPGSNRRFDWADAIYVGGTLNGSPTQYLQFNAAGVTLLSLMALQLTAGTTATIQAAVSIMLTAPEVAVTASTSIALDSPTTTVSGELIVGGTISATDGAGSSTIAGSLDVEGTLAAGNGWTGTFATGDSRTVTVVEGIITDVA